MVRAAKRKNVFKKPRGPTNEPSSKPRVINSIIRQSAAGAKRKAKAAVVAKAKAASRARAATTKSTISKTTTVLRKATPTKTISKPPAKRPLPVFLSRTTSRRGTGKLSSSVIQRQQNLSNQFGVTTFTRSGSISTVPTVSSGGFSNINVGKGSSSTFDDFADSAIQNQVDSSKSTGDFVTVSDPRTPSRTFTDNSNFDDGEGLLSSFNLDSIKENPSILLIGFVGLMVVMRLVKKI